MTDREKAIVMAHTGICMLAGEKFGVFHAYIEDIMGRPVYTHELAIQSISDEIKEKSRDDFIKLCKEEQESCEDAISRQAVLDAIDVKAWEFCDYLISKNRNDEQKPVSHFADNLRECVREELPSVTPQPKTGYISIDDVMSVFDDFMCGEVDEDDTDTFLKMLKDKAESES